MQSLKPVWIEKSLRSGNTIQCGQILNFLRRLHFQQLKCVQKRGIRRNTGFLAAEMEKKTLLKSSFFERFTSNFN